MASGPDDVTTEGEAATYLYGLEPSQFVAARNRLVKALRAAGTRDVATAVTALRKPSVLAAELNRLLRASSSGLDELLATGEALRLGHRAMLAGESVDLADLQAAHREAAARLARPAERDRDRITVLLEAASLDETCHDDLRQASFAAEPNPAGGFDLFAGAPVAPRAEASVTDLAEARARRRPSTEATSGPTSSRDGEDASAGTAAKPDEPVAPAVTADDVAAAAVEHERAERALTLAYRRTEAAAKKASKATVRVDELERRLADARANLDDTAQNLVAAKDAATRAEDRLSATADALRKLRAEASTAQPDDD